MNLPPDSIDQICEWLGNGVTEATATLFNLEALEGVVPYPPSRGSGLRVTTIGGFVGDLDGDVRLTVSRPFACILASRMLNLAESVAHDDALVNDVVAELNNMISGSVKSRLCDSGIACGLKIPTVLRQDRPVPPPPEGAECRQLYFHCEQECFSVELVVSVPARNLD